MAPATAPMLGKSAPARAFRLQLGKQWSAAHDPRAAQRRIARRQARRIEARQWRTEAA